MGKYRFEATVHWILDRQTGKQKNIPLEYFVAGEVGHIGERSDRTVTLPQVFGVFDYIEQARVFVIGVRAVDANLQVRPAWKIEELYLSAYDGKRHIHSRVADKPRRGHSMIDKGVQRITFWLRENDGFPEYGW